MLTLGNHTMIFLALGLILFLGVHSVRVFADGWRAAQLGRLGERRWKGLYSLVSLAGFVLMIWGFGLARRDSLVLWTPLPGMRHLAAVMTLLAFVLVVAAYVPGNRIKARIGHPMLAGTMIWALAHLLVNGTLAHAILFGGFLAWAMADFAVARRRDRVAGIRYPALGLGRDLLTVGAGAVAWILFASFGHEWLMGVRPLG